MIGFVPKSTNPQVASVRFRCLSPINGLRRRGVEAGVYDSRSGASHSVVVFSKQYDSENQALAKRLKSEGVITVLDLCDNHFYNPYKLEKYERARSDQIRMLEYVDGVICSTDALADVIHQNAKLPVRPQIVGDPVELTKTPARESNDRDRCELLWFGMQGSPNAPSGLDGFDGILPRLEKWAAEGEFRLTVLSDSRSKYDEIIANRRFESRFLEWNPDVFKRTLARATAVILPIAKNPFTECKSNNRLATSLFAGVPVIADRIPSYDPLEAFCWLDRWDAGLDAALTGSISTDPRTLAGQKYVAANFNIDRIAADWQQAISAIVEASPRASDYPGKGKRRTRRWPRFLGAPKLQ